MDEKEYVAATYAPVGVVENGKVVWQVYMTEPDGFVTSVQSCRSKETAERAAERWNRKEQAAVNRANKPLKAKKEDRRKAVDAFLASL